VRPELRQPLHPGEREPAQRGQFRGLGVGAEDVDVLAHRILQRLVVRQGGPRAQPELLDGTALGRPVFQPSSTTSRAAVAAISDCRVSIGSILHCRACPRAYSGLPSREQETGMQSTMMNTPLSLNHLLERAGQLFHRNEIVSRLPDKSLRRHTYGEFHRRTRSLASALQEAGPEEGRARRHPLLEPPRPTWSATSAFPRRAA
jgi:hypothetical protein